MSQIRINTSILRKDTIIGDMHLVSGVSILANQSGTNNIGSPMAPFDKIYANSIVSSGSEGEFVNTSGDTMTGDLNFANGAGITSYGNLNLSGSGLTISDMENPNQILMDNTGITIESMGLPLSIYTSGINTQGNIIPNNSGTDNIGSSDYSYNEIHAGSIYDNNKRVVTYVNSKLGPTVSLTTSDVPEGSNLYFTDNRARAIVSGTSPISVSNGLVSIASGSATSNGYISSGDWVRFDNSASASGNYVLKTGDVMSGTLTVPTISGNTYSIFGNMTPTNSGTSLLGSPSLPFNRLYVNDIESNNAPRFAQVDFEIPIGNIDGMNTNYLLLNVPMHNTLELYVDGVLLNQSGMGTTTSDYALSGQTITMFTALEQDQSLVSKYRFASPSGISLYGTFNVNNVISGNVYDVQNVGIGQGIYAGPNFSGNIETFNFKSIQGSGVIVTSDANNIYLQGIMGDFVPTSGGSMTGDLSMLGTNILTSVSGVGNIGSLPSPFDTAYVNNIYVNSKKFNPATLSVPNVIRVSQYAQGFTSIANAVNSITDAAIDKPYVVFIEPGVYTEPYINIPSYVDIVGRDEDSIEIQPSGNNTIFNMNNTTSISNIGIQNGAVGYPAITITNPGDYVLMHKVAFEDCDSAIKVFANDNANNHQVYLEYVDTTQGGGSSVGFDFGCTLGTNLTVSCENFYVYGNDTSNPPIGIIASGQGLNLSFRASALLGTDQTGIGIEILDGASVRMPVLGIRNWASGIYVPQYGSAPDIKLFSVSFDMNSVYNIEIDHGGTTGFSNTYSPFQLNNINPNSPFFFVDKDQKIVTAATKGGDFTSIASAVNFISDAADNNRYVVYVHPGTYYEPIINVKPWVNIVGTDIYSTVISPDDGLHDVFMISGITYQNSSISYLSIKGAHAGAAIYVMDCPSNFVIGHKISISDCEIGVKTHSMNSDTFFFSEYMDINAPFQYAVKAISDTGGVSFFNGENFYTYPDINTLNDVLVSGNGSQAQMYTSGFTGVSGTCMRIIDGGQLSVQSIYVNNYASGIWVDGLVGNSNAEILASKFGNNDMDIIVDSPNATGFLSGGFDYKKTYINPASSFYIENHDQKIITVAKKGGDFSSINDALVAISGLASSSLIYTVQVNPGLYNEPPMTVPSYVSVQGTNMESVRISPSGDYNLFTMSPNSDLSFMTIFGNALSASSSAVYLENIGSYTTLHKVYIDDFYKGITALNSVSGISSYIYLEYCSIQTLNVGQPDYALSLESDFGGTDCVLSIDAENTTIYGYDLNPNNGIILNGRDVNLSSKVLDMQGNDTSGNAIDVYNGATYQGASVTISNFNRGLYNENTGSPAKMSANALTIKNCNESVTVKQPLTVASLQGDFDKTLATIDSTLVTTLVNDSVNNNATVMGDLYLGKDFGTLQYMSPSIANSPTMGLVHGGTLIAYPPASGLSIGVLSGYGYLDTDVTDWTKTRYVSWSGQDFSLAANDDVYIYVDYNGNIQKSYSSLVGDVSKILLGRAVCNNLFISFVSNISMEATHFSNKADEYLRDVFGAIVAQGLNVTASGLQLTAAGGEYYYSSHHWNPSAKVPITNFLEFYHVSGNWTTNVNFSGVVNNNFYDNGVNLTPLGFGNFTRHAIWYEGSSDTHSFIYGNVQYSGLSDAKAGNSPTPPSQFKDSVVSIADIIVQQGSGTINTIVDTRPIPSYKAPVVIGGGGGATYHSQLLGLTSQDDHKMYLLLNGTNSMAADINMGGNNITNVNLVGGIVPSGHASRHLPNGFDPIVTAAPSTDLSDSSANSVGIQNSLSRSDHSHGITGFAALSGANFGGNVFTPIISATTVSGNTFDVVGNINLINSGTSSIGSLSNPLSDIYAKTGHFTNLSGMSPITTYSDILPATSGNINFGTAALPFATLYATTVTTPSGNLTQYTDAMARSVVSGSSPINVTNAYVTISSGNASTDGYITKGDWSTFSNKQASGNYVISGSSTVLNTLNVTSLSGTTISGSTIYQGGVQVINSGIGLGNVTVSQLAGTLTISGTAYSLPSTVVQTASNSGTGFGVYNSQSGSNLIFNTVSGNGNVTVTSVNGLINISGTQYTLPSTATFTTVNANLISGTTISGGSVYSNGTLLTNYTLPTVATFTTLNSNLISGTIISGGSIYQNGVQDISTIANSGSGFAVYNSKVGATAYLNTISGLGNVTVASSNGLITVSGSSYSLPSTVVQTASNSGTGFGVYNSQNGSNLNFNTISGNGNVTVTSSNGLINISGASYSLPTTVVQSVASSGTGVSLYNSQNGSAIYLNSISGLGTITISSQSNGVVNVSGASYTLPSTVTLTTVNANLISGTTISGGSIYSNGTLLTNYTLPSTINATIISGTTISGSTIYQGGVQVINSGIGLGNVTVSQSTGTLTISGTAYSLPSTVVQSASNSGTGYAIYNSQSGSNLIFNTISGIGNVSISSVNGLITVSGSSTSSSSITMPSTTTNIGIALMSGTTGAGFLNSNVTIDSSSNLTTSASIFANLISGNYISGNSLQVSQFSVSSSPNSSGINNNFAGSNAGIANTSGYGNAVIGAHAFEFNTSGRENAGLGWLALGLQTTGFWNTGMGAGAIYTNVSGNENTGIGADALNKNLASNNTAVGSQALAANTTGTPNDALGRNALQKNTSGISNVAIGNSSMSNNTLGNYNVAVGNAALNANVIKSNNVAIGTYALLNSTTDNNTAVGQGAASNLTSGTKGTFIGQNAQPGNDATSNEIVIGYNAVGSGTNTAIIGNSNIVSTYLQGNVLPTTSGNTTLGSANLPFNGIYGNIVYQSGNQVISTISGVNGIAVTTSAGIATISGAGVSSINSLNNALTLVGSGNMSVTSVGSTITISQTGSGTSSILNMVNEIPVGSINGNNKIFNLSQTPISGSAQIFLNGTYMAPSGVTYSGYDYFLSGTTVTFQTAPMSNSLLYAAYITNIYNGFVWNQIPTGSINGVNTIFTLVDFPVTTSTQVFLNGTFMARYVNSTTPYDYTISGKNIVFETAPLSGSVIYVNYSK